MRQILTAAFLTCLPVFAEGPYALLHTIPAPPGGGLQSLAGLGASVAVDGGLTVAGAPGDDTGAPASGVVKVFDTVTGALLHVIPNPAPGSADYFGAAVAISGSLVVVGAYADDTWAGDTGSAFVFDLSGTAPTVPIATLDNPEPSGQDYFGWKVAISGTRLVVCAQAGDGLAASAGSAYVYDLAGPTPGVPIVALTKPAPAVFDSFGGTVGISGDRVVIGATGDDAAGNGEGAAYVYDLNSATPAVPVTVIHPPDPLSSSGFGFPVAIDGTRVVVGAEGANSNRRIYVFDIASAATAEPVATFDKPLIRETDDFGYSAAISGTRVIVGAFSDGPAPRIGGRAYVFDLESATVTLPVLTLTNPSPALNDWFGYSLAVSGSMVVVTAVYDDTGATGAGSAYVFNLAGEIPASPVATLNHQGPSGGSLFGNSVAISGTRMVAGARFDHTGARFAGSAYVYDLASATPTVPALTLNNPEPAESDGFGVSVAISGSLAVVGATHDDTGATNAGSVYVYDLEGATPAVPIVTLHNPEPGDEDLFGNAVAISGTRVVVGAWFNDAGVNDAGSVYVYDLASPTPTVPVAILDNPGPAEGELFGASVAISGTRVVAGAPYDSPGADYAGAAYVYDMAGATPIVPVAVLNKPAPVKMDQFGISVAISGMRVVVGADRDDTGALDAGAALLYDLSGPDITVPAVIFNNPTPAVSEGFGRSVAISGTRVAIGAPCSLIGSQCAGSAYIYDVTGAVPALPVATLNNPGPAQDEFFGSSVGIDGTAIAIGTPNDGSQLPDSGIVYHYGPDSLDQDDDGLPDAWELTYWSTTAGHSAMDDFDHDGYGEILELAFGLNPVHPDPGGLPRVAIEDGYLTMTVTKHPGVTYEVQSAFTPLPDESLSFSSAQTRVLLDSPTTLKVRDHFLIRTVPSRYLRVKVTVAP